MQLKTNYFKGASRNDIVLATFLKIKLSNEGLEEPFMFPNTFQ